MTFDPHPLAILVALLSFVLVSGAPIYCGWRVLDRRAEKRPLATTVLDRVFGAVTFILGNLYGTMLAYWLGSGFHDVLFSWIKSEAAPQDDWVMILGLVLPFFFVAESIFLGIALCGANLCTTRLLAPKTWVRWKFLSDRDARLIFMGACSLITGVVGFIMVFADFVAWATF